MKKIKVTSEQYNIILLKEKEERLSCSDVIVNENFNQPELLLLLISSVFPRI